MTEQEKVQILVIDDDPALQELIRQLLGYHGWEAIRAMNATDGAAILRDQPLPACLLLDLMLPDVSGLELLRQIRAKQIFDPLPIIILSALADPETIRKGLDLGADRYITKPYLANNLANVITEILSIGRQANK